MSGATWSKMPCSWQISKEAHEKIRGVSPGIAIAGLKLYIGLCLKANYVPRKGLPETGCVKRSVEQLCKLGGLSKPMVIAGIRALQAWGVIELRGGRPATYHIIEYETAKYWTKLPSEHLYDGGLGTTMPLLETLPNRSKTTLYALQMYLYLASIRNRDSNKATVTYVRMAEVLGIGRNDISRAISALVSADLLSVRLGEIDDHHTSERPCNVYWLRGSMSNEDRLDAAFQASQVGYAEHL